MLYMSFAVSGYLVFLDIMLYNNSLAMMTSLYCVAEISTKVSKLIS